MSTAAKLPRRWEWLIGWFRWYVRRFVRKNFHAVRLSKTSAPWPTASTPLVVVLNHPSWWDPMLAVLLTDAFPDTQHYGAIDAVAVKKYRVFNSLGFFAADAASGVLLEITHGPPGLDPGWLDLYSDPAADGSPDLESCVMYGLDLMQPSLDRAADLADG